MAAVPYRVQVITVTGYRDGTDGIEQTPGPGECGWSWTHQYAEHGPPAWRLVTMCEHEHEQAAVLCGECAAHAQELHEDHLMWCKPCYYAPGAWGDDLGPHLCRLGPLQVSATA